MKKKITIISALAAVIILSLAFVFLAMGPFDERGLEYQVNADGITCTVTGIGSCKKRNIEIPEMMDGYLVNALAKNAFKDCAKLKSVSIPESVTEMGANAFYGCAALENLNFTVKAGTVGAKAFYGCKALKAINISDSKTTQIGASAFEGCTALETVTAGANLNRVGKNAFKIG